MADRPAFTRQGSGKPLLMIHGLGSTWTIWRRVIPALTARFDVLAIDLPGFGTALPLTHGAEPTVYALTDAVEQAIDQAGFETAHVVGHSMGGWIAFELAKRGRARDVLAISPAGGYRDGEARSAERSMSNGYRIGKRLLPVGELIARIAPLRMLLIAPQVGRPWRVSREDFLEVVRRGAEAPAFEAACHWLFTHIPEGLEQIKCPVTIAWGTRDRLLPPRQGERLGEAIPQARVRMLPGVGHSPMLEDPELIAQLVHEEFAAAG